MKFMSNKRYANGEQLICNDAIFDPDLLTVTFLDLEEDYIEFESDFVESGNPLNLPFYDYKVRFTARLTNHNIHVSSIVEVNENVCKKYVELINDVGDIEFDVRMTPTEKSLLLLKVSREILNKAFANSNMSSISF